MTQSTSKRRPATEGREQFIKLLMATGKTTVSRQEVKSLARSSGIRTTVVSWFVRNPANRAERGAYSVPSDTSIAFVDAPAVAKVAKAPAVKTVKTPAMPKTSAKTEVKKVASAPVDVLDEIDTNITDFEDREFAKGVVDGTI